MRPTDVECDRRSLPAPGLRPRAGCALRRAHGGSRRYGAAAGRRTILSGLSILHRIVDSLATEALAALDLAAAVEHPGESGRAREEILRQFLARILPPSFGIDTGFVVDALGNISRQIDIVVYRHGQFPILDVGGVKYFMVESVAAVLEVKATVGSTGVMDAALTNLASVKGLDRTNEDRNRVIPSGRPLDSQSMVDQVFSAVIAGSSMTYANTLTSFRNWGSNRPRSEWANAYVDVREFLIEYGRGTDGILTTRTSDPMDADAVLGGTGLERRWGFSPPLAFFAIDLLDFLSVTPAITFAVSSGTNRPGTGEAGYFYRTLLPQREFLWLGKPGTEG